ncbi:MAG: hypothetical protein H0W50_08075 [Parachlamydiaceae bacterium]|nr:hypothetical protein [Parachlamydiaceae bacterium]
MQRICPLNEAKSLFLSTSIDEPINCLPPECFACIFHHLNTINLAGLLASVLVNKKWQKNIIYNSDKSDDLKSKIDEVHKLFLGPQQWAKFYGIKFCSDEEIQKAFSILPRDIFETLNSKCSVFPTSEKLVKETHTLVYVSKLINGRKITLTNLGKLAIRKLPLDKSKVVFDNISSYYPGMERKKLEGYKYIRADVVAVLDKSLDQPHWVLLPIDLLEGSRGRCYEAQKKMVQELSKKSGFSYTVPKTIDAVASIIGHFLRSKEYLFGLATYIRCQHNIDRHQVAVGNFKEEGLCVNSSPDSNDIGIAPCIIFQEKRW